MLEGSAETLARLGPSDTPELQHLAWARHPPPASALPPGVGRFEWPSWACVESGFLRATMAGWTTTRGYTVLTQPIRLDLHAEPVVTR